MAVRVSAKPIFPVTTGRFRLKINPRSFPWWLAAIGLFAVAMIYLVRTQSSYQEAFGFIRAGLTITLITSVAAYSCSLVLGLLAGLGRISNNTAMRNISTLYVEVVRGIPMIVLIFFIALVLVPASVDGLKNAGLWMQAKGWQGTGGWLAGMDARSISMNVRAVIALAVTYGAFQAEVFRAGIQSVGSGQMEAARSQGMTYWQAMRYIVLPQAIRNMLPALGNDFISLLKDSSLVSVLAVRDITQVARLYAGQTFRFPEAYTILAVLYLTMTLLLSALVKVLEKRYANSRR